jgi:hypothetical protein
MQHDVPSLLAAAGLHLFLRFLFDDSLRGLL